MQFNDFVEQNKKEEEKRKSEEDKRKNDDKNIVRLSPFAEKLLAALCHRLTEKYGKKIKPSQVIEDYLIRYNVQRWSEWFHPFVLSDKEMLAIAQQVNPEIKSVREMRNALNIRNNED